MLISTQELNNKIYSNTLDALEIKQGDGLDTFKDRDFQTGKLTVQSTHAVYFYFEGRDCISLWIVNQLNGVSNMAVTLNTYTPSYKSTPIKGFSLLNKASVFHATMLPTKDYIVMGSEGGYIYMFNIKTLSLEATHQFRKNDITHIKYEQKSSLFVTRSADEVLTFFRYNENAKIFTLVEGVRQADLYSVFQAVKSNSSIKKFTVKEELDQKNIQCLHELKKYRPGLVYDFSNSITQQLDLLQRLEYTSQQLQSYQSQNQTLTNNLALKSKEIESLKLKHADEHKIQEEAFIKERQEKDHKIHQLEENVNLLKTELKSTNETVLNLKEIIVEKEQKHALEIEKLEQTLKEKEHEIQQRDQILKAYLKKPTTPLPQQLKEAKSLNETIMAQLLKKEQSIENWNLIKFKDDPYLLKYSEMLASKKPKPIMDINSLIMAINSVDENSTRDKINQILSILEDLISNYEVLPRSIKNEMRNLVMSDEKLSLSLKNAVKEQYILAWVKSTWGNDKIDLNAIPIPSKVISEANSQIFCNPLNKNVEAAIEEIGKKFLKDHADKLNNKLVRKPSFLSSTLSPSSVTNEEHAEKHQFT